MNSQHKFAPVVFDESAQAAQISHLRSWVKRVAKRKSQELVCRGISKFIQLDLLRYGNWPASFGVKRAFAVVWQSPAVKTFIDDEIYPTSPAVAGLLDLLADGMALMDTGHRNGQPEFIFYSRVHETGQLEEVQ